jgi:exodeoxyribonuclease VII small subunit
MAKKAPTDAPADTPSDTASHAGSDGARGVAPLKQAAPALPDSYEAALAELEQLVARMESGALPLDQLLVSYQRGAQLLDHCRQRLDAVEAQVKRLEEGQLKPWDAA